MVNRVNGNDYYDYTKLNMPTSADTTGSGEKFSLDYQRADDKKEEEESQEQISKEGMGKGLSGNGARTVIQSGVKLELSGKGHDKESGGRVGTFSDLIHTVRSWIAIAVQSFMGVLDRIWNDPVPEEEVLSAEEIPVEDTDRLSEEYLSENSLDKTVDTTERLMSGRTDTDKEIQKYLRSGNLEQAISLLTEDGHRNMAKNSTLLTYYDRTGRLTSLSASDQDRILHGDRNVKKL